MPLTCEPANPATDWQTYACPDTHGPLTHSGDYLLSAATGRRIPIVHGIPNFNTFPPAEDTATATDLERLNELAPREGWLAALCTVHERTPEFVRYVTDPSRAAFLDLLPITPESRVLEIGPGLGQFTPILARRAASVHALEVVQQQARFVAERCRQENVENVTVACGGDDCKLPYRDRSFDVVVLNLVFEWCGCRAPGDAEGMQRRLLAEMRRVLKPGGVLLLSTKNRYGLRYLLGGRDEHMHNIRFGSALPRLLGRLVLALRGKPAAPGRLYSWRGLRRMLRDCGLEVANSYWAAPEMRYPTRLIGTTAREVRAARREGGFSQGESRRTAAVMRLLPAGLVKHFTPGLLFLARRPAEPSASAGR